MMFDIAGGIVLAAFFIFIALPLGGWIAWKLAPYLIGLAAFGCALLTLAGPANDSAESLWFIVPALLLGQWAWYWITLRDEGDTSSGGPIGYLWRGLAAVVRPLVKAVGYVVKPVVFVVSKIPPKFAPLIVAGFIFLWIVAGSVQQTITGQMGMQDALSGIALGAIICGIGWAFVRGYTNPPADS